MVAFTSDREERSSKELRRNGTTAPIKAVARVATYLQPNIPLRERLYHFTFAWYTLTYVSRLSKYLVCID